MNSENFTTKSIEVTQTTTAKALKINLDPSRYGTFAEIGAGQEVARHFFQVGKASQTIAKSMSAYDMTFSDEIYGREKSGRYVCESRVIRMLEKEYQLLQKRLGDKRGSTTCFFAFANTVATGTPESPRCHGWMGLQFQTKSHAEPSKLVLHVRMRDHRRLQQQEALGILGVNMMDCCFYGLKEPQKFVSRLVENLKEDQIYIDLIHLHGPAFENFNLRQINLELILQGLAEAILFSNAGDVTNLSDTLFGKSVVIERGNFEPFSKKHSQLLEVGLTTFSKELKKSKTNNEIFGLFEYSIPEGIESNTRELSHLSKKIDGVTKAGFPILITRYKYYYQLKQLIKKHAPNPLALTMGVNHLEKVFEPRFYSHLEGKMLEGMGKLLDDQTKIYVQLEGTKKFIPPTPYDLIYTYFLNKGQIVPIN